MNADASRDRLRREARGAVAQRTDLLTADQVSAVLGGAAFDLHAARRLGVLALSYRDEWRYPAFQFDAHLHQIRPIVLEVNEVLNGAADGWGVASWWVRSDARLRGRAPASLLGTDQEEQLLVMARAD